MRPNIFQKLINTKEFLDTYEKSFNHSVHKYMLISNTLKTQKQNAALKEGEMSE